MPSQLHSYALLRPPEGEWKSGAQDPGHARLRAPGRTQGLEWKVKPPEIHELYLDVRAPLSAVSGL